MLPSKASSTGAKMVNPLLPPEPKAVRVLSVLVLSKAAAYRARPDFLAEVEVEVARVERIVGKLAGTETI